MIDDLLNPLVIEIDLYTWNGLAVAVKAAGFCALVREGGIRLGEFEFRRQRPPVMDSGVENVVVELGRKR